MANFIISAASAWKSTNGNSQKLAQLSMTIFLKFWSRDRYPICIHGSQAHCSNVISIVEQVPSEVVEIMLLGRPLACHFANTSMGPTWVLSALDGPHVGPMTVGCFKHTDNKVCILYIYRTDTWMIKIIWIISMITLKWKYSKIFVILNAGGLLWACKSSSS